MEISARISDIFNFNERYYFYNNLDENEKKLYSNLYFDKLEKVENNIFDDYL